MNNSDMPAMAVEIKVGKLARLQAEGLGMNVEDKQYIGLTKREHFAGLAMQGLLANQLIIDDVSQNSKKWIAEKSISLANALLAELDKEASA